MGFSSAEKAGIALGAFSTGAILMGWIRWLLRQWIGTPKIVAIALLPRKEGDITKVYVSLSSKSARGIGRVIGRDSAEQSRVETRFFHWGLSTAPVISKRMCWGNSGLEEITLLPNDRGYDIFVAGLRPDGKAYAGELADEQDLPDAPLDVEVQVTPGNPHTQHISNWFRLENVGKRDQFVLKPIPKPK